MGERWNPCLPVLSVLEMQGKGGRAHHDHHPVVVCLSVQSSNRNCFHTVRGSHRVSIQGSKQNAGTPTPIKVLQLPVLGGSLPVDIGNRPRLAFFITRTPLLPRSQKQSGFEQRPRRQSQSSFPRGKHAQRTAQRWLLLLRSIVLLLARGSVRG